MSDRPKNPQDFASRRTRRRRKARAAKAETRTDFESQVFGRPARNGAWQIDAKLCTQGSPFTSQARIELAKGIILENRRAIAHGARRVRVRLQINNLVTNYIVAVPVEYKDELQGG